MILIYCILIISVIGFILCLFDDPDFDIIIYIGGIIVSMVLIIKG